MIMCAFAEAASFYKIDQGSDPSVGPWNKCARAVYVAAGRVLQLFLRDFSINRHKLGLSGENYARLLSRMPTSLDEDFYQANDLVFEYSAVFPSKAGDEGKLRNTRHWNEADHKGFSKVFWMSDVLKICKDLANNGLMSWFQYRYMGTCWKAGGDGFPIDLMIRPKAW
jgi:hypothetical protein